MAEQKISRRRFVKGAGLAGAAGVLAGCAAAAPAAEQSAQAVVQAAATCPPAPECPAAPECPTTVPAVSMLPAWTEEADIVVVGSGTGLAGAVVAAAAGDRVFVLEKAAVPGGSMAISGGIVWVPNNSVMKAEGLEDSREKAIAYETLISQGGTPEDIIEADVDNAPEMLDFLIANTDLEFIFGEIAGMTMWEYHPEWEGAVQYGRSVMPKGEGYLKGPFLGKGLVDGVEAKGAKIMLETPAKRLVTRVMDDGRQEVLGVVAESGGKEIYIKAAKAVLLAAGGYEWDKDMCRQYLKAPYNYTINVSSNTGDGIKMAMAVGADLWNMGEQFGQPVWRVPSEAGYAEGKMAAGATRGMPGSIIVNRYGERFGNEASDYDSFNDLFFHIENVGLCGFRNLPSWVICDETYRLKYGIGSMPGEALPDWVIKADTLAELAELVGIDPDGLEKTVAEFNENAKAGVDPKFQRGESLQNRIGLHCDRSIEGPGATLAALETGPFYAAELAPGNVGTSGGARVNANAQVISAFGEVIPRLYASGNNSGVGGPGACNPAGGCPNGRGLTFSYIAAKHALTLEPWA